jgi:rhamnogalacturonyl hydrolase YesR
MPKVSHGIAAQDVHKTIQLLINQLVNIKDETGEFLLRLDDGRVIDTKGWNGWEWTHGIGLYGLNRSLVCKSISGRWNDEKYQHDGCDVDACVSL